MKIKNTSKSPRVVLHHRYSDIDNKELPKHSKRRNDKFHKLTVVPTPKPKKVQTSNSQSVVPAHL